MYQPHCLEKSKLNFSDIVVSVLTPNQMFYMFCQRLEEILQEEARKLHASHQVPLVLHSRVLQLVRENKLQLEEDELAQVSMVEVGQFQVMVVPVCLF